MADKTSIEWTDATWSPIRAKVKEDAAQIAEAKGYTSLINIASKMAGHVGPHCERCSDGCDNCYSHTNNHRCLSSNGTGLPFDRRARDLVDIFVDENALTQPLRWKKGRRIFVENQSDLFGEWVPDVMIDRVVGQMAWNAQHTYQALTKRARRLMEYSQALAALTRQQRGVRMARAMGQDVADDAPGGMDWPLPNVWFGVSVEDQQRADERIPLLLQTPAAIRFLSVEPLLGPVDLLELAGGWCALTGWKWTKEECKIPRELRGVDWVIVGGESGPGARPCDVEWIRYILQQCDATGVACFVKQLGKHPTGPEQSVPKWVEKLNGKGGNWEVWPRGLRVRQMPKSMEAACR